jgi:hypothetical protein
MSEKDTDESFKPLGSWKKSKEDFRTELESIDSELHKGLTPDDLEKSDIIKYHHRAGLNSFLSENYACTFYYDDDEWSSAQHAYQVACQDVDFSAIH